MLSRVTEHKHHLRRGLTSQRGEATESQIAAAGEGIAERLKDLLANHRTVATFMPVAGEPAFTFALHRFLPTHRFAYPACSKVGRDLTFHFVDSPPTRLALWGIPEPDPTAPAAHPREIDAVICPGLAFDRQGGRLGMGAGYYDRFLCRTRPDALLIGIGYDWQLVDHVPMEAHDIPVHYFVSPSMILRTHSELHTTKLLEIP